MGLEFLLSLGTSFFWSTIFVFEGEQPMTSLADGSPLPFPGMTLSLSGKQGPVLGYLGPFVRKVS